MANLAQNGKAISLVVGMLVLCGILPAVPGEPTPALHIDKAVVTALDNSVPPDGYNDTVDVLLELAYDVRAELALYEIRFFVNDSSGKTVDCTSLRGKLNTTNKTVSVSMALSENDPMGQYNVTCTLVGNDTMGVFSDESTTAVRLYPPGVYQPVLNAREYSLFAEPGEYAVYRLNVTNQGNCPDTVYLTVVSDKDWRSVLDANNFLLAPGETRPVLLCVTVPEGVSSEDPDWETVKARSTKDPSKTSTVQFRTGPSPLQGNLSFVEDELFVRVSMGWGQTAPFRLVNHARYDDSVTLTYSKLPLGCQATFGLYPVYIEPGGTAYANLSFRVDKSYTGPPVIRVTATARSRDGVTNITASATFQIYSADLRILPENISLSNYHPMAGEAILIHATISNIGIEEVDPVDVAIYSDSNLIFTTTAHFRHQTSCEVEAPWTVPCGETRLRVVVDPGNSITDLNRLNNTAEITLNVSVPILVIYPSDVWISAYHYHGFDAIPPYDVQISVRVRNIGAGGVRNANVGLAPCNKPTSTPIYFIPANGSAVVNFTWRTKSGEGSYNFTANVTGNAQFVDNGTTNVTLVVDYPPIKESPPVFSVCYGCLVGLVLALAGLYFLLRPKKPRPQAPQGPDGGR